jgi:Glycosyl hydrolase family 26
MRMSRRSAPINWRSGARRLSQLSLVALFVGLASSQSASAATTYLRPNADRAATGWSAVGAPTAWQALADPITPAETPSSASYVQPKCSPGCSGSLSVDMSSTSLAGITGATATAWFYTPEASWITMAVRRPGLYSNLGSGLFTTAGWHSVTFTVPAQPVLDDVALFFTNNSLTGLPKIYSALIQLNYTPAIPKVYWGAWIDGDVYTASGEAPWPDAPYTQIKPTWNTFEAHAGKAVSLIHFGQPAPWNQAFASGPLENTRLRGAIPLMDMDPDGVALTDLLNNRDAEFKSWFKSAAAYSKPFFFRWSWEMNGKWFKPYGEEAAANPALYVEVWRHLYDLAKEQGASNITWVWCPNVSFEGSTSLAALYPGDAYVDWTCMDGYNRGDNPIKPEGWKTFEKVFSATYSELLALAPSKPIMIGEVGSTEIFKASLENKAEWIATGLGSTLASKFPKIRALLWFNWNIEEPPKSGNRWDWQIESSTASQESFKNVISSPYFAGNTFGELPALTKIQPLP